MSGGDASRAVQSVFNYSANNGQLLKGATDVFGGFDSGVGPGLQPLVGIAYRVEAVGMSGVTAEAMGSGSAYIQVYRDGSTDPDNLIMEAAYDYGSDGLFNQWTVRGTSYENSDDGYFFSAGDMMVLMKNPDNRDQSFVNGYVVLRWLTEG